VLFREDPGQVLRDYIKYLFVIKRVVYPFDAGPVSVTGSYQLKNKGLPPTAGIFAPLFIKRNKKADHLRADGQPFAKSQLGTM
jgi:hypothetical protein